MLIGPIFYLLTLFSLPFMSSNPMAAKDLAIMRTAPMAQNHPADSLTKHIYLTFDDGPTEWTNDLLDILLNNNVKATFFMNS